MLIKKPADVRPSEITPPEVYQMPANAERSWTGRTGMDLSTYF